MLMLPPGWRIALLILSLVASEGFSAELGLNAQLGAGGTFRALRTFEGDRGSLPLSGLTFFEGELFGTTSRGGRHGAGVLFQLGVDASNYQVLHHFDGKDGADHQEGLLVEKRAIFGATRGGGKGSHGTLYRFDRTTGSLEILHRFGPEEGNGFHPHATPIRVGQKLIGMTFHGGESRWGGMIYAYDLETQQFSIIKSLDASTGRHPLDRLLAIGGWLYGTASDYGDQASGRFGTLFRLRPDGSSFEVLHRFEGGAAGAAPIGRLSYDGARMLFGSAFGAIGDSQDLGILFSFNIDRRVFSVLHDFSRNPNTGGKPDSALVYDPERALLFGSSLGTENQGGNIAGTLFCLRPDGSEFTVLHTFSGGLAGRSPLGAPVLLGNSLLGVTAHGGVEARDRSREVTGRGILYRYDLPEAHRLLRGNPVSRAEEGAKRPGWLRPEALLGPLLRRP